MRKIILPILVFVFSALTVAAQTKQVVSGPMLGHVELRTAQVWIELQPGIKSATLSFWQKGRARTTAKKVTRVKTEAGFPNTFQFSLVQLEPGTSYEYQITTGAAVTANGNITTQSLWQWRTPAPEFSFLTGSCAYFNEPVYDRPGKPYGGDSSIFSVMAKEDANFMLWLGDNWYTREADYFSEWGMYNRASHDRSFSILQPLLKAMPQYAIWDDHDYGPNDADKSFILKETSRDVFKNYWANASYGQNSNGIYTKMTWNDVEVFMLDDRWFRSNDATPDSINGKPNPEKRMFGTEQLEWLKNSLRQSNGNRNVSFRIIATGSQVLNPVSPYDCFRHYPAEFYELLRFLEEEKIDGVVFLTGDRHHSEIFRRDRKGAYPLYDVTASSLTAGTTDLDSLGPNDNSRVLGIARQNNYAKFSFSGAKGDRTMKVEFISTEGEKLNDWSVQLKDISFQRR